ncbi:acyl-CoA dehydrogenase family protein [Saccharopolyspora gloriosae]|uniref:acyl-CoA dehydrogenase family protein n=1 Tax=Saccharopolyspora gloriosae TaxID=455344 RepID=UPI001FB7A47A|nr:acyl-CoA dehydrogenase family protein [Saccharopolyspora gloriosae]
MKFARTTGQLDMAEALRALLDSSGGAAVARSWADGDQEPWRRVWDRLGEMGLCGVAVPHRHGGLELDSVELALCLEELGYAGLPGPCLESIAVVPALLADTDAEQDWLPALAAGRAVATAAFTEHVPRALDADAAAVLFRCDGDSAAVARRPDGAPERSIDPTRRLWKLDSGGTTIAGARVAAAFDVGVLGCAAQSLGVARRLLDTSVRYVGERHQFGRPVGGFQAVKHHVANVALKIEFARPLLYGACLSLDSGAEHAPRDVSAAKLAAAEAAHFASRTALQVHGAIGYTAENDLQLWLTKATALRSAWGTAAWHRRRVADALADGCTAPIGS